MINGNPVRIDYHENKRSVMWSDNWPAIVDASHESGDPRFTRRDDGHGTYGSTTIVFHPDAIAEELESDHKSITAVRIWIYWNEGIVRITVREDSPIELYRGGPTDEGWSAHEERYSLEDGILKREMRQSGSDCDGRHERGTVDYWQPEFGTVPCIEVDSQGNCKEVSEQRPNWHDAQDIWQRDYAAEAAGY
jgi:hypothetical protein